MLGTVCFYVLCNRHWFNRVCPGGASGDCLSTLRSFSDAGCADQRRPTPNHIGCPSQHRARVCRDFISRSPGQALYGAKSACAKPAATRDPPPRSPPSGIPRCPGGLYRGSIAQGKARNVSQHWVLPGPATGSHIVNRGTPVASLGQPQLNVPEKKSHPLRGPCSPDFPNNDKWI